MKIFLLNLALMGMWIASTGEFTYANALLGFGVGFGVLWWLRDLFGGHAYFRKAPMALIFVAYFLWEVLLANLRVAWDVVTPQKLRKPAIVAVPLDARTDLEITVLANLVTLTPGSLTVDVSDDRTTLYVHAMFVDDPDKFRREIKEQFEHWVLKLLR